MSKRNILMLVSWLIFTLLFPLSCKNEKKQDPNWTLLRKRMVEEQIIKRGIKDKRVINAMLKVPRHLLIPKENRKYAYEDHPVPIGYEQTISQPYIVALMTELLELKKTDKVLEIGTGSGYQAAILAEICKEVYTIEIIPELGERAKRDLKKLGYKNIKVKVGDGFLGWDEYAPFDKIIITCSVPDIPPPLVEQLKEGGRIVAPIGEEFAVQILATVDKKQGELIYRNITGVRFVPMTGEEVEKFKKEIYEKWKKRRNM